MLRVSGSAHQSLLQHTMCAGNNREIISAHRRRFSTPLARAKIIRERVPRIEVTVHSSDSPNYSLKINVKIFVDELYNYEIVEVILRE